MQLRGRKRPLAVRDQGFARAALVAAPAAPAGDVAGDRDEILNGLLLAALNEERGKNEDTDDEELELFGADDDLNDDLQELFDGDAEEAGVEEGPPDSAPPTSFEDISDELGVVVHGDRVYSFPNLDGTRTYLGKVQFIHSETLSIKGICEKHHIPTLTKK